MLSGATDIKVLERLWLQFIPDTMNDRILQLVPLLLTGNIPKGAFCTFPDNRFVQRLTKQSIVCPLLFQSANFFEAVRCEIPHRVKIMAGFPGSDGHGSFSNTVLSSHQAESSSILLDGDNALEDCLEEYL